MYPELVLQPVPVTPLKDEGQANAACLELVPVLAVTTRWNDEQFQRVEPNSSAYSLLTPLRLFREHGCLPTFLFYQQDILTAEQGTRAARVGFQRKFTSSGVPSPQARNWKCHENSMVKLVLFQCRYLVM